MLKLNMTASGLGLGIVQKSKSTPHSSPTIFNPRGVDNNAIDGEGEEIFKQAITNRRWWSEKKSSKESRITETETENALSLI